MRPKLGATNDTFARWVVNQIADARLCIGLSNGDSRCHLDSSCAKPRPPERVRETTVERRVDDRMGLRRGARYSYMRRKC